MFKETMEKIGEPVAPSDIVENVEDGLAVADTDRLPGRASSGLYPGRIRRRYCPESGAVRVRSWKTVSVFPV